ncbi:Nuclear export mediator factor Nemf [Smittium culicis]|uniref:Nuclear export mediator factor Nemf n=1 Tax=Smittium culicis TaxID=133412 RepID=A0A1R1XQ66_9FUNG|nr:Nuclear export mediator factor Nemf [Smittium culicis]
MKSRFTALDVRASAIELSKHSSPFNPYINYSSPNLRIVGLRIQNIYDINSKTYMFKFQKPGTKVMVVIESGTRIHSTEQALEKNSIPSHFSSKVI